MSQETVQSNNQRNEKDGGIAAGTGTGDSTSTNNNGLDGSTVLFPPDVGFYISWKPLLLGEYDGPAKAGCVTVISPSATLPALASLLQEPESAIASLAQSNETRQHFADRLLRDMKLSMASSFNHPSKQTIRFVKQLIQQHTDCAFDLIATMKAYSERGHFHQPAAGIDEVEWLARAKSPLLRSLALLRRLAMPMHVQLPYSETSKRLIHLQASFLDLILDIPAFRQVVGKSVLFRIDEVDRELAIPSKTSTETKRLKKLRSLLVKTIGRAGIRGTTPTDSFNALDDCDDVTSPKSKDTKMRSAYAVPAEMQEEVLVVRSERKRLLSELDQRKQQDSSEFAHYTAGGKIKLPNRMYNGSLLVTEQELSHEEFCKQVKLMMKVNKTLPRPFHPNKSRPRLHKVNFSQEALERLRSIFFEANGSLRRSIVEDIDLTSRHGYINFSNASCRDQRNDYRWQVPMQRHGLSRTVPTRSTVESLFAEEKILHPGYEKIHDLGILIGGTEDQSIHHDIPRQTTCWLPNVPDPESEEHPGIPVTGWEFDRAAYNEAMASPYAPSSLLLGMGDSGDVHIGVQKNQIERYGCKRNMCRIVDGGEGEEFSIVRENDFLVVLRANPGCLFTGDFPHAGVRNFPLGSSTDRHMMDFYQMIETILEKGEQNEVNHSDITKEIISMMCNFPRLDTLCRFHCSTEPISGPLRIPRNTVGFVDCRPNPPDTRFDGASKKPTTSIPGVVDALSSGDDSSESSASFDDLL